MPSLQKTNDKAIKSRPDSGQVVEKWKNESKREKLFENNRFVSKDKLKKYQRSDKLDNVLNSRLTII